MATNLEIKSARHSAIRELIEANTISSQEELKSHLATVGYAVAQPTLSRDIKEMGLVKTRNGYCMPEPAIKEMNVDSLTNLNFIQPNSIISLEFGTGIAVIHTAPGHASMVAACIDNAQLPPIMGTIAGDDTILLMLRRRYSEDDTTFAIATLAPDILRKRI
jgi:transcriptional regulator of arginine metabolism